MAKSKNQPQDESPVTQPAATSSEAKSLSIREYLAISGISERDKFVVERLLRSYTESIPATQWANLIAKQCVGVNIPKK